MRASKQNFKRPAPKRGPRYLEWRCASCGEILQGIIDKDGDFISDKEIEMGRVRAVGCYLCGGTEGEVLT